MLACISVLCRALYSVNKIRLPQNDFYIILRQPFVCPNTGKKSVKIYSKHLSRCFMQTRYTALQLFRLVVYNAELLHAHALHYHIVNRSVTVIRRHLRYPVHSVHTLGHLAECGIFAVKMRGVLAL